MIPLLKTKLALKAALIASGPIAGVLGLAALPPPPRDPVPVVTVAPGAVLYRAAGDFAVDGRPVNAPRRVQRVRHGLVVMRTQVTQRDYQDCVDAGACMPLAGRAEARADRPATGVSWQDASSYAAWFAGRTGQAWRLPTDVEWAHFAGSRFADDAVIADDGSDSFARRWLARYDQESGAAGARDKEPKPVGSFGQNERGLSDLAGNVWEWTDTCFERQALDARGVPVGARTTNCGVRVVEGEHRSYVTDFIRDARAGGCAVGLPPANLGFRLVREDRPGLMNLLARWRGRLAAAA
ncbi:MAG: SUMF1/EgtB/PvdO family nonheme iron enzyme [Alsobacter sp.]